MTSDLGPERPYRALLAWPEGVRVELVPAHGVLVAHLVDVAVGHVVLGAHLGELLGRPGPGRVGVRVVHLPADVVDADLVAQLNADRIGDEASEDVAAEDVARPLAPE